MSSCFIQIHHRCSQYKAVACLLVSNENCEAKLDNPLQASNLLTETTNPQQNTKDKTQPYGVQKQSCKIKICEVHTQKKIAKHRNSLLVQASDVWLQLQKLIFGLLQQVQHYPFYLQFQHDPVHLPKIHKYILFTANNNMFFNLQKFLPANRLNISEN